jgi:hypothetical protein
MRNLPVTRNGFKGIARPSRRPYKCVTRFGRVEPAGTAQQSLSQVADVRATFPMRAPQLLLALSLAALLVGAPLALAQGADKVSTPPASAQTVTSGNHSATFWVVPQEGVEAGANGSLVFVVRATNNSTVESVEVQLSSTTLLFANATSTRTTAAPNASVLQFTELFTAGQAATGNASYSFTLRVTSAPVALNATAPANESDANATQSGANETQPASNATASVTTLSGGGVVPILAVVVPTPAPLVPTPYLVGGGVVLLVAVAIGAYAVRERNLKRRMQGEKRRSQVMREMELEKELERVEEKQPEKAAAIKQEIRQQEVVREKRRELQILEAKRADVLKNMDLLRKRHEMGGLSKLQFDNMIKKREADLAKIEAEIAEMERLDSGASAA